MDHDGSVQRCRSLETSVDPCKNLPRAQSNFYQTEQGCVREVVLACSTHVLLWGNLPTDGPYGLSSHVFCYLSHFLLAYLTGWLKSIQWWGRPIRFLFRYVRMKNHEWSLPMGIDHGSLGGSGRCYGMVEMPKPLRTRRAGGKAKWCRGVRLSIPESTLIPSILRSNLSEHLLSNMDLFYSCPSWDHLSLSINLASLGQAWGNLASLLSTKLAWIK